MFVGVFVGVKFGPVCVGVREGVCVFVGVIVDVGVLVLV